jgi:hypothetical protein
MSQPPDANNSHGKMAAEEEQLRVALRACTDRLEVPSSMRESVESQLRLQPGVKSSPRNRRWLKPTIAVAAVFAVGLLVVAITASKSGNTRVASTSETTTRQTTIAQTTRTVSATAGVPTGGTKLTGPETVGEMTLTTVSVEGRPLVTPDTFWFRMNSATEEIAAPTNVSTVQRRATTVIVGRVVSVEGSTDQEPSGSLDQARKGWVNIEVRLSSNPTIKGVFQLPWYQSWPAHLDQMQQNLPRNELAFFLYQYEGQPTFDVLTNTIGILEVRSAVLLLRPLRPLRPLRRPWRRPAR